MRDLPAEAVAEGLTYIPPIDPPILPGERDGEDALVASGFGLSAHDEPYDADHHGAALLEDDEVVARVREALRADSSTAASADHIRVIARGGVVTLRGSVDDLVDSDSLVDVAAVAEVNELSDELHVRNIEGVVVTLREPIPAHSLSTAALPSPAISPLTPAEMAGFRERLEQLRDKLHGQIADLEELLRAGDEEAGADNAPADHATELHSITRLPSGKMARATRAVSSGTQ